MEPITTPNEKIERYLLNRMTETEKAAFQLELLQDDGLRNEVKMMRRLQKTLVAEQRMAKQSRPSSNWKWWLPLLLLPLVGFYFWNTTSVEPRMTPEIPVPESTDTPVLTPAVEDIKPVEKIPEIENSPEKSSKKIPEKSVQPKDSVVKKPKIYAGADPIDLVPNPLMEQMMTGVRSNDFKITLNSPGSNGKIKWQKAGTALTFAGEIETEQSNSPRLNLLIFSNKKEDFENWNYLQSIALKTTKTDTGFRFSNQVELISKKGLYYYLIENADTELPVFTGKFFLE